MGKKMIEVVCEYLEQQQISKQQIEEELQLVLSTDRELSASEFLTLCSYIHVKPEYFMSIMKESREEKI